MNSLRRKVATTALTGMLVLGVAACGGDDGGTETGTSEAATEAGGAATEAGGAATEAATEAAGAATEAGGAATEMATEMTTEG